MRSMKRKGFKNVSKSKSLIKFQTYQICVNNELKEKLFQPHFSDRQGFFDNNSEGVEVCLSQADSRVRQNIE